MKYNTSKRVENIKPFMVMTLLERAIELEEEGKSVVHFEIGEPDFDTPKPIINAAMRGCQNGKTHYTHSAGMLDLRKKISAYKKNTRGIQVDPKREIIITAGSSPAFFISLATLINPGDEVIITDPGYPCYQNFIKFFGGKTKPIKIYEKDIFNLNINRLEEAISSKTKVLILNSPSNPTGQIIPQKTLEKIATLAMNHDFYIISDEIYAELTYTGKIAPSISEIPEMGQRTIILDGFSKFWAMTGWRLGYLIAPHQLIHKMNRVNQNFFICAPSISQVAGIKGLDCLTETKEMLNTYKNRRDYIVKRINNIDGMSIEPPTGAFYAFTNIKQITSNSKKFSWELLEKAHVAATPGIAFGKNGEGYIRFSYCTSMKNLKEGFDRIEDFLEKKD